MAKTEWWQRGPVDGVPAVLQPVAHILLQVRESVVEMVEPLTEQQWNARPGGVASAAFHVRHIADHFCTECCPRIVCSKMTPSPAVARKRYAARCGSRAW